MSTAEMGCSAGRAGAFGLNDLLPHQINVKCRDKKGLAIGVSPNQSEEPLCELDYRKRSENPTDP